MARWLNYLLLLIVAGASAAVILLWSRDGVQPLSRAPDVETNAVPSISIDSAAGGTVSIVEEEGVLAFRGAVIDLAEALQSGHLEATPASVDVEGIAIAGEAWSDALQRFRQRFPVGVALNMRVYVIDAGIDADTLCEELFANATRDPVRFQLAGEAIRTASYATLDRLVDYATDCRRSTIAITGHSDSLGSEAYNKSLSERRAQAVADYLVERGVQAGRLAVSGVGSAEPIADNATRHGRVRNRRIEFARLARDD